MIIRTSPQLNRIKKRIEALYLKREKAGKAGLFNDDDLDAIEEAVGYLDRGHIRAAQKVKGEWITNEWVKKAILLYFQIRHMEPTMAGPLSFADKIPVKRWKGSEGVRVVPPGVARFGSYISRRCVLMPSFVNIGAYIGEGTMVDTWATVGSCAQIGAHVHLSGGVGIGGVLEPLQAAPVVIEDHAFVGSRAVIVEGVIVEESAVIAAGVILTSSTKIIDVSGAKSKVGKGRVPARSVVIPGVAPKEFPGGTVGVSCALIIGQRSESTDKKTSLNDVLRKFEISV